uniref:Integrase catalytic domain-containing protein n=1 Tax=Elaeophora elaphi TaxID=1147741 RepID=A0A158Q702_9BILA
MPADINLYICINVSISSKSENMHKNSSAKVKEKNCMKHLKFPVISSFHQIHPYRLILGQVLKEEFFFSHALSIDIIYCLIHLIAHLRTYLGDVIFINNGTEFINYDMSIVSELKKNDITINDEQIVFLWTSVVPQNIDESIQTEIPTIELERYKRWTRLEPSVRFFDKRWTRLEPSVRFFDKR